MASVMANSQALQLQGWYLSAEGLEYCSEDGKNSVEAVMKVALDLDLKQIGERHLPEGIKGGRLETVDGPFVLQIQKVRNVTAPKDNEESQAAPPMLKLTLTDGHNTCSGLEMERISGLSLNTPPGTKVQLQGKVSVSQGFLMLNGSNCRVLGGRVAKLVENWEVKRTLAKQSRNVVGREGGPPPFVPFGQRHRQPVPQISGRKENFRSLESNKEKKEVDEFEQQRQATIAEALQAKGDSKSKFGPAAKQVSDKDVAQIVEMGFSPEQASSALRQTGGNMEEAINSLLKEKENRGPRGRGRGERSVREDTRRERPERGGGRGRRGRGDDDEYDSHAKPSATTLFDFLPSKVKPKDMPKVPEKEGVRDRDKDHDMADDKRGSKTIDSQADKRGPPNLPPRLLKQQQRKMEEQAYRGQPRIHQQGSTDSSTEGKKNWSDSDNKPSSQRSSDNFRNQRSRGPVNGHNNVMDNPEPPPYPNFEGQGYKRNYNHNRNNYYDNRYTSQNQRQNPRYYDSNRRSGDSRSQQGRGNRGEGRNREKSQENQAESREVHSDHQSNHSNNGEQTMNGSNNYILGVPSNVIENSSRHGGWREGGRRSQSGDQTSHNKTAAPSMEYREQVVEGSYMYTVQQDSRQQQVQQIDNTFRGKRVWKPDDFCLAKYYDDGGFYRATINSVDMANQTCSVTYTDYGNTEDILLSDIRAVPKTAWETNNIQPPANSGAPMIVPVSMTVNPVSIAGPPVVSMGDGSTVAYATPMSGHLQGTANMSMPGILVQGPPSIPMGSMFPAEHAYQQAPQVAAYQVAAAPHMSDTVYQASAMQAPHHQRPAQALYVTPAQQK